MPVLHKYLLNEWSEQVKLTCFKKFCCLALKPHTCSSSTQGTEARGLLDLKFKASQGNLVKSHLAVALQTGLLSHKVKTMKSWTKEIVKEGVYLKYKERKLSTFGRGPKMGHQSGLFVEVLLRKSRVQEFAQCPVVTNHRWPYGFKITNWDSGFLMQSSDEKQLFSVLNLSKPSCSLDVRKGCLLGAFHSAKGVSWGQNRNCLSLSSGLLLHLVFAVMLLSLANCKLYGLS